MLWGALVLCLLSWGTPTLGLAQQTRSGPPRTFVRVKGDLWRAGNGNWWSLVYVTPEGILLADPISPDFAAWLKGELQTRFPGKAVRYVIYSHSHWDHIGGAAVFADSHPHIIGQERMLENMDGRWPHMPGNMFDRNHNGKIESEEIAIPTLEHPGICGMGEEGRRSDYGYPVHVVYSLVGLADIDSVYWLIRDASGHWEIPAVCVLR
jgi:hypothetical protein